MGNGDEPLFGEFPQGVYVGPHVQLTAHQHHFGVGTELLSLSLPLWKHGNSVVSLIQQMMTVRMCFNVASARLAIYAKVKEQTSSKRVRINVLCARVCSTDTGGSSPLRSCGDTLCLSVPPVFMVQVFCAPQALSTLPSARLL